MYLLQHATRAPSAGARVDERLTLNLPDFDGGAYVRLYVEDTSARRGNRRRRKPPVPHLRFRLTDCVNEVNLAFAVDSPAQRENSLHKANTLLGAVERFRDALEAEAELYEARELPKTRKEVAR